MSRRAAKELDKLSDSTAKPILSAIAGLSNEPRPRGCEKLKGRDGYRIRVGSYRVIYDIFDGELIVDVITLGHRRDIYD
ncbi:type II toxin-antitoxin system RelE family toxin [Algoriphagus oliviformis]|uniref:type II toxin-antitoxin system RelE family toxin n=1 Tax=Algoriphagus oliviformis TaxID=2811231 RepID=UPI0021D443D2|nr:type II toxin-antitoxin system RelE/ParE family toxin [Algoriphagus oliviformis]